MRVFFISFFLRIAQKKKMIVKITQIARKLVQSTICVYDIITTMEALLDYIFM